MRIAWVPRDFVSKNKKRKERKRSVSINYMFKCEYMKYTNTSQVYILNIPLLFLVLLTRQGFIFHRH